MSCCHGIGSKPRIKPPLLDPQTAAVFRGCLRTVGGRSTSHWRSTARSLDLGRSAAEKGTGTSYAATSPTILASPRPAEAARLGWSDLDRFASTPTGPIPGSTASAGCRRSTAARRCPSLRRTRCSRDARRRAAELPPQAGPAKVGCWCGRLDRKYRSHARDASEKECAHSFSAGLRSGRSSPS